MSTFLAIDVHIILWLMFYSAPSEATCTSLSKLGYTIADSTVNSTSCRNFGGAWVSDCCLPCSINAMARGLIIAENRFFPRMEAALSFNYSRQLKLLLVLPGVYPAPGNCKSTINYDSVQIIGVCGHQFTKFDCNGSSFHFKVTGQNITIQGLQLMNGNSDENGGCIAITPPATGITIIDTFLLNCFSEKNGGAISFTDQLQESHSIAISILGESSIESCSAVNGGALYISMDSRSLPLKYFNCY